MKKILQFLVAIIGCEIAGIFGAAFTLSSLPTWYNTLQKPLFSPPNWVFGPVWTLLYFLMGVSAFLIWQKGLKKKNVKDALLYFTSQLFFNFVWSILFFGLHSPILGFLDILILWALILFTIMKFYRISRLASYLLIPYLLWVSFATILNFFILILN